MYYLKRICDICPPQILLMSSRLQDIISLLKNPADIPTKLFGRSYMQEASLVVQAVVTASLEDCMVWVYLLLMPCLRYILSFHGNCVIYSIFSCGVYGYTLIFWFLLFFYWPALLI